MMITSGLNAKRFAGKPLKQPLYRFESVPKCNRDLKGSTLYEVVNRDDFIDATAEMVLLCNEAMRRSRQKSIKNTSKPLSLEYIADRLDIDDPMTGFFVRDKESKLQGFITCTTFTNWQKTFRWDSVHEASFSYDEDSLAQQMLSGERAQDVDGSLAAALQQSIHCGDPYNEGIVWPRIAEISLLGGLGCGKALVSMAIERLETLKATNHQNYDFVVLQATENSVPFYESMGFVRVGALTVDGELENKTKSVSSDDETESDESAPTARAVDSQIPAESVAAPSEIVSSPVDIYVVEKPGETPLEIAKKFNLPVWDVVYLNHYVYKDLNSRSYLMKGTSLYIPSKSKAKADAFTQAFAKEDLEGESSAPRWFVAKENDTPKGIARKFGVPCKELVQANIARLPELLPISRLKEGTRVKVSHFHLHEDYHVPYCHWTFPDDTFDNAEPSYMMARKLNRRFGVAAKDRPIQASFSVPVSKYKRPPAALFHVVTAPAKTPKKAKPSKTNINIPGKPKGALSAYIIFCNENRGSLSKELAGKPATECSKVLSARWKNIGEKEKAGYQRKHESAKKEYEKAMIKYENNLKRFFEKHPDMRPSDEEDDDDESSGAEGDTLFNKVVTVKPGTLGETHKDFQYFYVLTYIPDLVWCHLAPMRQVGYWGADKPQCQGRPKWMLVDESEGKEVDISASFCQHVKSRAMKRTVDADNEEWDIPDSDLTRKMPASNPGSGPGEARTCSPLDSKKKAKPSSTVPPTKTMKSASKIKKRKRCDAKSPNAESYDSSKASPDGSCDREGSSSLPPKAAAPIVYREETPPPKMRKVAPISKKPTSRATREMPPRRAAPRIEGVFLEAKSPKKTGRKILKKAQETQTSEEIERMVSTTPVEPAPRAARKSLKKRGGSPKKSDDKSALEASSEPVRKAPKKTLKTRRASLDAADKDALQQASSPVPEPVVRAPRKTLKKRGGSREVPTEETMKEESPSTPEPTSRAPRKTLKKRGGPVKIPFDVSPVQIQRGKTKALKKRGLGKISVENSPVKASDGTTKGDSDSKPRGVHRELPRRRAAPKAEGFFSESPRTARISQQRRPQLSAEEKSRSPKATIHEELYPESPGKKAKSKQEDPSPKSTPGSENGCKVEDACDYVVTIPETVVVSGKIDASSPLPERVEPMKRNIIKPAAKAKNGISLDVDGTIRSKKRLRTDDGEQKRDNADTLAIRPLRNRKATQFFSRASLDISSPLLLRHGLVAS